MSVDYCQDCGLCCKKMILEIEHVDVVREPRLLPVVRLADGGGRIQYEDDWEKEYILSRAKQPCPMLDGCNRCMIYPTRPNICVAFEVGGEECNNLREIYGLPEVVKGGTGV